MGFTDILSRFLTPPASALPALQFDRGVFFDVCRHGVMGPTLSAGEVQGAEALLDALEGLPVAWTAYALATAWHETAHTMQPIREMGGPAYLHRMYDPKGNRPLLARKMGNVQPGDGARYCGRGYVQLTWRCNYIKAGKKLGVPLEQNPALAMKPDVAAKIMRYGMTEGWFTGKAFKHFLPSDKPATKPAFTSARRIINGMDKASLIAGYALEFQSALVKAGWK